MAKQCWNTAILTPKFIIITHTLKCQLCLPLIRTGLTPPCIYTFKYLFAKTWMFKSKVDYCTDGQCDSWMYSRQSCQTTVNSGHLLALKRVLSGYIETLDAYPPPPQPHECTSLEVSAISSILSLLHCNVGQRRVSSTLPVSMPSYIALVLIAVLCWM